MHFGDAFIDRWLGAINRLDFRSLESLVDPDVIIDYPQSGERLRGFEAMISELEHYPGGIPRDNTDVDHARLIEPEDRWAISPGYTVVPMAAPDRFTTVVSALYPDGRRWWLVTAVQVRNDRVVRMDTFFAPEMPAPLAESIPAYDHA